MNLDLAYVNECAYYPIPKALEFYKSGLSARQRLWLGAVRSRKTSSVIREVGYHATGFYPDWWPGYRYKRPTRSLVATVKATKTRDILQKYLLEGDEVAKLPPCIHSSFVDYERSYRAQGIRGGFDTLFVKHITGGFSRIKFASFSEGAAALQSDTFDLIHLDEMPEYDVYNECLARTAAFDDEKTFVLLSMWPEKGMDELVSLFLNNASQGEPKNGHFYLSSSWADNPGLSEEEKERLRLSFPAWQLDAREHGIPVFGQGKVFTFKEDLFLTDIVNPEPQWRVIGGVDPSVTSNGFWGACKIYHDSYYDIVYVLDDYKVTNITAIEHCQNLINLFPNWVPIIIDPAGHGEDLQTKENAIELLKRTGSFSVQKAQKGKGTKESVINDIFTRVRSDKFKISKKCVKLLDEFRRYSRDEKGRIIKQNDHILDSLFYALNNIQKARTEQQSFNNYYENHYIGGGVL